MPRPHRIATRTCIGVVGAVLLTGCASTPSDQYVSADKAFGASASATPSRISPAYSVQSSSAAFGGMYDTREISAQQLVQSQKAQMAQSRQQAAAAQQEMMQWGVSQPQKASGYYDPDSGTYAAWKSQNGL